MVDINISPDDIVKWFHSLPLWGQIVAVLIVPLTTGFLIGWFGKRAAGHRHIMILEAQHATDRELIEEYREKLKFSPLPVQSIVPVGVPERQNQPVRTVAPTAAKEETAGQRIFAQVTPESLMRLYAEHMHADASRLVAPYLGKWMRWSGTVYNKRTNELAGTWAVTCELGEHCLMFLLFEPTWSAQIAVLQKGEQINVLGKITDVSRSDVSLSECELL